MPSVPSSSLLPALSATADAASIEELAEAVLACVGAVLGVDSAAVCLNEPDASSGTLATTNWGWPTGFYDADQVHTFETLNREDPWILATHTRAVVNGALRISDRLRRHEFRSLLMYGELFAPLEIEHQVAFSLPAPDRRGVLCVALNRARHDFSDREIDRLEMLRRPLAAVVGASKARSGAARETTVPADTLTARETSVLSLVAAGHSSQQIGSRLGISMRTVEKHLEHIYAKTGTGTRTGAAVWWLSVGDRSGPQTLSHRLRH